MAAISHGELSASVEPWISEWGNPPGVMPRHPSPNQSRDCAVGDAGGSGGTETSQYPDEKKSTEIPSVVVSESGTA